MCSSSAPLSLSCQRFSFGEIEMATNDFASENFELKVYYGKLYSGNISRNSYSGKVCVIRLDKRLGDVELMFENEIKVLTACHHVNIISLVGFCDEKGEKVLVYEFMPNHSLFEYLHGQHIDPLTVEQRLEICLGVAKGICYLHTGTDFPFIHGRIDVSNIVLDASLVPKISSFRYGIHGDYSPPECNEAGYKLSQKTDVYAFGVVFLEVLCERETWNRLLVLAPPAIMKGELLKCTPEHVKKNITQACARQCEKLVMNCLEYLPDKRLCMNQVVQDLELALKLQKEL